MSDYGRKEYRCEKCYLFFNCTETCVRGELWCPYCGHKIQVLSENALYIKGAMETELKVGKSTGGREQDYQYYWGMIDFAKTRDYINLEEGTLLHKLKDKFRC